VATTTLPRSEIRRIGQTQPAPLADPVLPGLIIGPAYHLRDYPLDRATINIGAYGSIGAAGDGVQNGRPVDGSEALLITSPPDNALGAVLDRDSVKIFSESSRIEIVQGSSGVRGIVSPEENLFTADSGSDLAAAGVRVGDQLVITYAVPTPDFIVSRTIVEIGGVDGSTLLANQCRVSVDLTDPDFGVASGPYFWRVERVVGLIQIPSSYVTTSGLRVAVAGGIQLDLDLDNDGSLETVPLSYGVLYMQYRSLRQDLAKYTPITDSSQIEQVAGRIDERNPLGMALAVAFRHTNRSLAIFGITRDNLNGIVNRSAAYSEAMDALATRRDIYGIAPLASELGIIQSLQSRVDTFALPEYAAYRRLFASHGPYPTTRQSIASRAGVAEIVSGELYRVFASVDGGFASAGVAEDDILYLPTGVDQDQYTLRKAFDDDRMLLKTGPSGLVQDIGRYYALRGEGTALANAGAGATQFVLGEDRFTPASRRVNAAFVGKALRMTRTGGPDTLVTSAASVTIQNLRFDADVAGEDGNLISVEFIDPSANSEPLAVAVTGSVIEVTLATNGSGVITSTATQVKAAIDASSPAAALVNVTIVGLGSTVQTAAAPTLLSGGRSNGRWLITSVNTGVAASLVVYDITYTARDVSSAGSNVKIAYEDPGVNNSALSVSVLGRDITVSLATDGGGSIAIAANTATNVLAAVQASAAANALVSAAITGTASAQQTALLQTNLVGGADPYYVCVGAHRMPATASSAYQATIRDTIVSQIAPTSYTIRRAYRGLYAAGASFLSGSVPVEIGDEIQVPTPAGPLNENYGAGYVASVVAQVLSDSRLTLDVYEDLPLEDPEDAASTSNVPFFRGIKPLTKQQQAEYLVSIVQSFGSSWFSHVFPDAAEVTGINDASTGLASPQPGYYMAVAIMALCTALPVQQPLTRRALVGFGALSNSNYYFSPEQIELLSNSGYLAMVQDQPDSPPYVLHQITTDLTDVKLAELSSMRCYDYVARRLKAVIDSYIGRVNISTDVLELIAEALNSDMAFVKSQKVSGLGAPMLSYAINSVRQNPARADGVQAVVSVDFPAPLNNIQLFIEG
jgi:hypothetical protein